ncbi:MAG: HAD-IIIA family hydrolase [Cryomorphaceae bacterium]|nr:HAD-IIIA family hydrolase [Cryomorphaceae bacterium]
MYLEQNIKGLCARNGIEFDEFLSDLDAENVSELTVFDLEAISEEYEVDLLSLLFKPMFRTDLFSKKLEKIKLLVLDVDGVMTDAGMYYTENGDQIKKYNAKDGMAIQHLVKSGFQLAIISSGYKAEMVKTRAELLGIQFCYVGREPKLDILQKHCEELGLKLENVAIIGDDINDLEVFRKVGFTACPSDAVLVIKSHSDVILSKKGGEGCVREFVDAYLLKQPLT